MTVEFPSSSGDMACSKMKQYWRALSRAGWHASGVAAVLACGGRGADGASNVPASESPVEAQFDGAVPLEPGVAPGGAGGVGGSGGIQGEELPLEQPGCFSPGLVNEAVIVHDQAELEALRGCTTVHGDLTILPFAAADLRPLAYLTTVEGTFTLGDPYAEPPPPGFPSLEGLEALRQVSALSLRGLSAPSLEVFLGLSQLAQNPDTSASSRSVYIDHCSELTDLHGLENMAGLGGFVAKSNPKLSSVEGLQVPAELSQFEIWDSPVRDLRPLHALTTVGATLWFMVTGLTSAAGLEHVSQVGQLQFWRNAALVDVSALGSLSSVRYLSIGENPNLSSLPGFDQLIEADGIFVNGNATLVTVPPFRQLRQIKSGGATHNPLLSSFFALSNLEYAEEVYVDDNPSLVELDLGRLEYVRDQLRVTHNPLLDGSQLPHPPDGAVVIGGNLGESIGLAPCPWSNNNRCEGPPLDDLCALGTDSDCLVPSP